jgi:hypothetical protein
LFTASITRRDEAHLGDVARYIHANYWVVSKTDFGEELSDDRAVLLRRENEMLNGLPAVFAGDGGNIRIYDLRCFQTPTAPGCRARPATQGR